jgi:hypothetical protein
LSQRSGEPDPYPWTWEIPLAIVLAVLGVRFADRPEADPSKRPVREIVGVDLALNQRRSNRRVLIKNRQSELVSRFQCDHPVVTLQLAQATLEARGAKHDCGESSDVGIKSVQRIV